MWECESCEWTGFEATWYQCDCPDCRSLHHGHNRCPECSEVVHEVKEEMEISE